MRGSSEKNVSGWQKPWKVEEGIISASKSIVRKVESDEEGKDFKCYSKSDEKPVHIDIDKEVTEGKPTLALIPNRSEEYEINNNGETRGGNGKISVRRSNRIF